MDTAQQQIAEGVLVPETRVVVWEDGAVIDEGKITCFEPATDRKLASLVIESEKLYPGEKKSFCFHPETSSLWRPLNPDPFADRLVFSKRREGCYIELVVSGRIHPTERSRQGVLAF